MIYGWMGIFEFENVVIGIVRMGIRYYVILTVGQLLINLSIDWLAYVLVSASAYSAYIINHHHTIIHHGSDSGDDSETPKSVPLFLPINFRIFKENLELELGGRRFIIHT